MAKSGLNIFAYPREAPQTPIYTAEGKAIKLGELKGKFLLVMFWSRYCAPCIRELDEINTFVNKTKDTGIEVLLVSKEDEWTMPGEQKELLKKANQKGDYDAIADEILRLRDMRKQSEVDSVIKDEQMKKINDLQDFIRSQPTTITEFDEVLVRRLISKITRPFQVLCKFKKLI